jgi:hypothetical protein
MALEESTIALADPSLLHEQAYIDGEWSEADSGATFVVANPGTGEALARVPRMGLLRRGERSRPPTALRATGRPGRPPNGRRFCAGCAI